MTATSVPIDRDQRRTRFEKAALLDIESRCAACPPGTEHTVLSTVTTRSFGEPDTHGARPTHRLALCDDCLAREVAKVLYIDDHHDLLDGLSITLAAERRLTARLYGSKTPAPSAVLREAYDEYAGRHEAYKRAGWDAEREFYAS